MFFIRTRADQWQTRIAIFPTRIGTKDGLAVYARLFERYQFRDGSSEDNDLRVLRRPIPPIAGVEPYSVPTPDPVGFGT